MSHWRGTRGWRMGTQPSARTGDSSEEGEGGIHWPDLDEDISVEGLAGRRSGDAGLFAPVVRNRKPNTACTRRRHHGRAPQLMRYVGLFGEHLAKVENPSNIHAMPAAPLTREDVLERVRAAESGIRALGVDGSPFLGRCCMAAPDRTATSTF